MEKFIEDEYCLFHRWGDGMANDPWYVGYYHKAVKVGDKVRHKPQQIVRTYQHCKKITHEQGTYLVENALHLEDMGACLLEVIADK